MRWEDERYVRLYTRDTTDWLALSFDAQALFALLLRKVDRAGLLPLGKHGKRGVAIAIGHPRDWPRLEPALEELLADGCVRLTENGGTLAVPNFLEAQEANASDKARQQKRRETAAALAAAQTVTRRDDASHAVTEHHAPVTSRHDASRDVTPSRAVPCRAEPSSPSEGTDSGKPSPASPLVLATQEPEKPKRAPSPTALGEFIDWARAEVKPHLRPDAPDPAVMQQHQRIRLGEAVKAHGLEACKAAFRLWMGWTVAQEKGYPLGFFAAQWEQWVGQVKAPGARASPTQAVGRGAAQDGGECDGCGESQGYCAPVGPEGDRVRLGGACGCWTAWQGSGLGYADAPEWARNRRAGRAA